MAEILVIEDEPDINELIRKNLKLVGHCPTVAFDGEAALTLIEEKSFDLILLDIMLPGMSGFDIMRFLTRENHTHGSSTQPGKAKEIPVIFLTARNDLQDRLRGLNMGADDYIVKPFEMLELLARVEAVLRRTGGHTKIFELGEVKADFESRQIFFQNKLVECTPKEFDLLEALILNRNIALSREKLLELVWGYDYMGDTRTVDVHIQRIRKKLSLEDYIKTVYKMGYRLEVK